MSIDDVTLLHSKLMFSLLTDVHTRFFAALVTALTLQRRISIEDTFALRILADSSPRSVDLA